MRMTGMPGWPPRGLKHLSFRGKCFLLANLLLVVLILGFAFRAEWHQRAAITQEVETRASVLAQSLAPTVAPDLITNNHGAIERSVLAVSQTRDLVYVVVLDKESHVAARFSRDDLLGRGSRPPGSGNGDGVAARLQSLNTAGTTVLEVTLPVTVAGSAEVWGAIRLGVSQRGMHQDIARMRWEIAGLTFLALLVVSGIGVVARLLGPPW
jgi:sensor histidine kinase regulating citrate/malate metabolism